MLQYESIIITDPGTTEDEVGGILRGLAETVQAGNGKLLKVERWGKRRLGYRVGRHEDGVYTLMYLECTPDLVRELERRYRMNDRIIKYLTVRSKDTVEAEPNPLQEKRAPGVTEEDRPDTTPQEDSGEKKGSANEA